MTEILPIRKANTLLDELREMEQKIMKRAYDIFLTRGAGDGHDLDNWIAAENELVFKPAIELEEKNNEFKLTMIIVGTDPKDINIEVTPDDLLVKAERRREQKSGESKVHTSEGAAKHLFRTVHFPKKIDPNKVKAELKNGMLHVSAQIAEEAKAHKIDLEAA